MSNDNGKILKYNHGEKSMKAPFIIYTDLEHLLKKFTHVKIILKNHQQPKTICIHLLVTHCLQVVHLMQLK